TDQEALALAAALVGLGVDPARVAREVYATAPGGLELMGRVLSTLTLHLDGRLALVRATDDMFRRTDTVAADLEGFIEFPRSVAGVEVAALLRPLDGRTVKVSLRSNGRVNVAALAEKYGGGGHHNAAGLSLDLDPAAAEALIEAEVEGSLGAPAASRSGAGSPAR
ncbi:MAG: bifunctional oligoribonuclease/PAP phosphatase NrnA, partial [Proteobacteria bacterium]|nr:bifunctional oligoribonuclease/PAP phosphatase NrnA [Pseudomonadota bacterium]